MSAEMTLLGRSIFWDLVVAILGINLWVTFLLIPLSNQPEIHSDALLWCSAFALVTLFLGIPLRSTTILLGGFPCAIMLPVYLQSRLASVEVYSGWTFSFVALALLGYTVGTLHAVQRAEGPPLKLYRIRAIEPDSAAAWHRRIRITRIFALVSILLPFIAIGVLLLQRTPLDSETGIYSAKSQSKLALLALILTCLWLPIYQLCIRRPLQKYLNGDLTLQSVHPTAQVPLQRDRQSLSLRSTEDDR